MSVLKLTLVSDPSKFRAGLAAASKDLAKFQRTANTVSKGINRALGAAGIGLGMAKLAGFLKESAKASTEDTKSKNMLALALQNTVGATQDTIAQNEKWIASVSLATAQFDDNLRPALAQTVRATGSLTKGQGLLRLALDVSAGTGKDLGVVTVALSRAYAGNQTALKKLIPGIQLGSSWVQNLQKSFAGAAIEAANSDPYQKFAVLMDQIKETVGAELVPALAEFGRYLASPQGKQNLQQLVDLFVMVGKTVGGIIKLMIANIGLIKALVVGVIAFKVAWWAVTGAIKLYDMAVKFAAISTRALKYALISTGIGAIIAVLGTLTAAWISANEAQQDYYDVGIATSQAFQDALKATGDATVELNEQTGQIWKDGKLIFDQTAFDIAQSKIAQAIDNAKNNITNSAEKFRDAVGLAFGTFGKDENSVFNVDMVIAKLKRMVDAAKGFANNLKQLTKQGAGQDVINELINMGPAQGNIVAKGLLSSGRLSEYLGLRGSLYGTGASAAGVMNTASTANYTINLNKTNVSATDIINAIRQYEKKTGRKYFAN